MDEWDKENKLKVYKHLSPSTRNGLRVTIAATLRLFDFLVKKHDFTYLMTDRLNQDALEVKNQI
jgi:hypothetical protein